MRELRCRSAQIPRNVQSCGKNPWKRWKNSLVRNLNEKLYCWKEKGTTMCIKSPIRCLSNQLFKAGLNGKGCGGKVGQCEFISNVIGIASEWINLIKIIGVHPLYVISSRGWGHSMLAISGELKRVWRWITFPLLEEIIQFVNFFFEKCSFEKMWGWLRLLFQHHLTFICLSNCPFLETVERGVRNDNTIKSSGQSTQYQSIILLEGV